MKNKSPKRLAIYVHYDSKGDVRDYALYCLNGIKEAVSEIMVVVNGELSEEGRRRLDSAGVTLLVRENKDFDFGAWKAAIEHIGYRNIARYDELLLTNNSFYGPIYPFSEMWDAMDATACDFWGINMHPRLDARVPRHIQSYWMVFRKKILVSDVWRKYWINLPSLKDLLNAVFKCEARLTGYFEGKGFKSAAYMNFEKYDRLIHDNPTLISDIQVMDDKCPVVKRKFFYGLKRILPSSANDLVMGFHAKRLMDYLEKNKPGFADIIWDDMLKTQHLSTLNDHLNLNFILSSALPPRQKIHSKAAVIMYIYYEDMVEYCHIYSRAVPAYIDIVIVHTTESVREKCERFFSGNPNKTIYIAQPNRGRDNAALLVTCREIINQYDLVCFVHGKKTAYTKAGLIGSDFREHCFSSLLYSVPFVENIIETFNNNPRLGFLVPFTVAGGLFDVIANEWAGNYDNTMIMLKHRFNIEEDYLDPHPIAPFGGMFWARTKALSTLMSYNWQYEDFPEEPFPKIDGLLVHAIERLMPRLAQNDGFYTAFTAPDKYAGSYVGHMYYMNRELKVQLFDMIGVRNDMQLLRDIKTLNDHIVDLDFWRKHRFLLEIAYTYYKLLRKIATGDLRQSCEDNWQRLKAIRRIVKKGRRTIARNNQ